MADQTAEATAKQALRTQVRQRRRAMSVADRNNARAAVRGHVLERIATLGLPPNATIAGYEPLPTEPGSSELLQALRALGYRVIVPITLPDRDLDWRRADDTEPLGIAAIADAAVVLLPAFSVDPFGNRLGRGGGSYDRALARIGRSTLTAVLLFADEMTDRVPAEAWDRPVRAAVTPDGWFDLA